MKEHLEVYAAIRGVPADKISALVEGYMTGLRIKEHEKKYAKDCSGGTKRKLSYAMAMLGDPKIVLLGKLSHYHNLYIIHEQFKISINILF